MKKGRESTTHMRRWDAGVGFVLACMLAALAYGCASHREQADQAFLRDDWDSAVHHYRLAIEAEADLAEVAIFTSRTSFAQCHMI